jgi:hypothetical protein
VWRLGVEAVRGGLGIASIQAIASFDTVGIASILGVELELELDLELGAEIDWE